MTTRVTRLAKRAVRRTLPLRFGAVLLYHRIADVDADPQLLAVSPGHFAEHLEVIAEGYQPVRLDEMRGWSAMLPTQPRPIALTFDDGYADNLGAAWPLLRARGVPATVFVVADQVGRIEEFWWDELERILLGTGHLPESLEVTVGSDAYSWLLPPVKAERDMHWNVESDRVSSPREAAYRDLCGVVRPLDEAIRGDVLAQIRAWAGTGSAGRPEKRALIEQELFDLTRDGLVEVGSHTMTHPVLAAQRVPVQEYEIDASWRKLEDLLGTRIRSFAYPFGGRNDYDRDSVRLVKASGYAQACSNFAGVIHRGTRRLEIPRLLIRDWSGDEFARRLHALFRG